MKKLIYLFSIILIVGMIINNTSFADNANLLFSKGDISVYLTGDYKIAQNELTLFVNVFNDTETDINIIPRYYKASINGWDVDCDANAYASAWNKLKNGCFIFDLQDADVVDIGDIKELELRLFINNPNTGETLYILEPTTLRFKGRNIEIDLNTENTRMFKVIYNDYIETREIYESVLQLDYRLGRTPITDDTPDILAPEYEKKLENITLLLGKMARQNIAEQYTTTYNILLSWVKNDIALYCQYISRAISKNNVADMNKALEYKETMNKNFMMITDMVSVLGSKINYPDISDINNWSPESYIQSLSGSEKPINYENETSGPNIIYNSDTTKYKRRDIPSVEQEFYAIGYPAFLYITDVQGNLNQRAEKSFRDDGALLYLYMDDTLYLSAASLEYGVSKNKFNSLSVHEYIDIFSDFISIVTGYSISNADIAGLTRFIQSAFLLPESNEQYITINGLTFSVTLDTYYNLIILQCGNIPTNENEQNASFEMYREASMPQVKIYNDVPESVMLPRFYHALDLVNVDYCVYAFISGEGKIEFRVYAEIEEDNGRKEGFFPVTINATTSGDFEITIDGKNPVNISSEWPLQHNVSTSGNDIPDCLQLFNSETSVYSFICKDGKIIYFKHVINGKGSGFCVADQKGKTIPGSLIVDFSKEQNIEYNRIPVKIILSSGDEVTVAMVTQD